jgi:hypothetical protein
MIPVEPGEYDEEPSTCEVCGITSVRRSDGWRACQSISRAHTGQPTTAVEGEVVPYYVGPTACPLGGACEREREWGRACPRDEHGDRTEECDKRLGVYSLDPKISGNM